MGFRHSYDNLILKLALIGGPDFVNCVHKKSGNHIGFRTKAEYIPLLAEISGDPEWINHKNSDGFTCVWIHPVSQKYDRLIEAVNKNEKS